MNTTIELDRIGGAKPNTYEGTVTAIEYRGPTVELGVDLASGEHLRVLKTLPGYQDVRSGERVWIAWGEDQGVVLAGDEGST